MNPCNPQNLHSLRCVPSLCIRLVYGISSPCHLELGLNVVWRKLLEGFFWAFSLLTFGSWWSIQYISSFLMLFVRLESLCFCLLQKLFGPAVQSSCHCYFCLINKTLSFAHIHSPPLQYLKKGFAGVYGAFQFLSDSLPALGKTFFEVFLPLFPYSSGYHYGYHQEDEHQR